jgi:SAM-dependent methyltransferase
VEQWNDPTFAKAWTLDNSEGPHSPLREQQLDLLVAIVRAHCAAANLPPHILDLGCGPGIVATRILDAIPGSTFVGVDASPPMLDMARARLAPYAARHTLASADFERIAPDQVPGAPFSAVIAVQAIHNCSDEGKQRAYATARAVLAPGGIFVLSDRIRLATPTLFPAYLTLWDTLDREYAPQGWQHSEGRTFAEHDRLRDERGDKPGSLEQNLLWLREAGFAEVAAVHVVGIRAVIVALAPATQSS